MSLLDTSGQPIELPSAKKTLILERRSTTGEQENDTEVASILSPALHLQFPSFSLPVYIDAEKQLSHAFQVRTDFDYTEARLELQFPDGQTVSCERIAGFQYRSTGEVGTCRAKGFDIEVSYDSKVYTFDTEKKAIISLQEGENTYDIIYTPTGELLAVSNTLDNTIIFHSVGDQIESISDIYGNEVELRYTGFDESLQLERIVYPAGYQDVGEEALEDIVLDTKSSRFPLVYSGSTVNAEDQYIDYVRGADTKLYAIQGHEVYEVGELGRKKVFSASHDIQSLTVASSGNIYRYDGSLKKYQAYNGKIFDYKMNGGKWGSMAVNTDESYLYLVNPLAPGYSRFDLKRGVLRSVYTDEFLRAVGYFDDFLHMYSLPEIQTLEKNPEFSEKYGKVLPKIEERIHLLSPEKRESLKSQIKLEKQHILDKIANRYRKEKIRFLLSSIEEALSQVLAF
ncbi:MAG: hypothetical protein H6767_01760 [Candidatus Peribacteria bacterium]|nr:MAG: hypothetical protein H6767_01760 [Candidatus Peribacteria bacterium]